jgi:hypothetical protein
VFEVIYDEQGLPAAEVGQYLTLDVAGAERRQRQTGGDGGWHILNGLDRDQRYEPDPVFIAANLLPGGFNYQAGFADSARPGDGQQGTIGIVQPFNDGADFGPTADKLGELPGQIGGRRPLWRLLSGDGRQG